MTCFMFLHGVVEGRCVHDAQENHQCGNAELHDGGGGGKAILIMSGLKIRANGGNSFRPTMLHNMGKRVSGRITGPR